MATKTIFLDSETLRAEKMRVVGCIRLVQKEKRCGKDGCTRCPHQGFWYADAAAHHTKSGERLERYLGKVWDEENLFVLSHLLQEHLGAIVRAEARASVTARRREALLKEVERLSVLAAEHEQERDHAIKAANDAMQKAVQAAQNEYRREASAVAKALKAAQSELEKLRRGG